MNNYPIGFFDSGIGGLSIWKEVNTILPNESTIYLADSQHAPYGEKSKEEILSFSIKNTEVLLGYNCKVIIVACNTATTNTISELRKRYKTPFIGIEPATKPAVFKTKTGKVGILATAGTLVSELFLSTSNPYRERIEFIEKEGKGLVRLIEENRVEETKSLLQSYLQPMIEANVDSIVLGCTHYPFLKPVIKQILPSSIQIIDSGKAVARHLRTVLEENNLLCSNKNEGTHHFFSNSTIDVLKSFVKKSGGHENQVHFLKF